MTASIFFKKEHRTSSGHGCAEKRKEGWKGLSGNRINKSDWSDWSIGCFCAEPFNTNDINCYSAVKAGPYGTRLPSCYDHKRDSDPRPESDAAAYYSPCTQAQKRRGMHWKTPGQHSRYFRIREAGEERNLPWAGSIYDRTASSRDERMTDLVSG